MQVDPSWEKLPGTEAGAYYRIAPDVILAVPKSGYVQDEQAAAKSLEVFDAIAHARGRKQSIIVLVDRVGSQDTGARRVWARNRKEETRSAQALVCSTLLGRAIGSFFLGLNKAAIPTKMFASLEEARDWAQAMANEDAEATG